MEPIATLTDSDDEPVIQKDEPAPAPAQPRRGKNASSSLAAVSDLTESSDGDSQDYKESGMKPPKPKRRKESGLSFQQRLVDGARCREMLGKKCKSCKRVCLAPFLQAPLYDKFLEFREIWKDTHKLDQDRMASWLLASLLTLFRSALR